MHTSRLEKVEHTMQALFFAIFKHKALQQGDNLTLMYSESPYSPSDDEALKNHLLDIPVLDSCSDRSALCTLDGNDNAYNDETKEDLKHLPVKVCDT